MNGVEILSQSNVYEVDCYWWILIIFAGIGLLIGIICSIVDCVRQGFDACYIWYTIGLTIVAAFVGLIFTFASEHETDTVDYVEYKVTVSDEVNFTEFMNKYEVLDQDGKIYIVKEKE